jgi:hypothetical protein
MRKFFVQVWVYIALFYALAAVCLLSYFVYISFNLAIGGSK